MDLEMRKRGITIKARAVRHGISGADDGKFRRDEPHRHPGRVDFGNREVFLLSRPARARDARRRRGAGHRGTDPRQHLPSPSTPDLKSCRSSTRSTCRAAPTRRVKKEIEDIIGILPRTPEISAKNEYQYPRGVGAHRAFDVPGARGRPGRGKTAPQAHSTASE